MLKYLSIYVLLCLYGEVALSKIASLKSPMKVHYDLNHVDVLFNNFRADFNKMYSSEEALQRRKIFTDNLMKINQWNQEEPDAIYGIGPFTDMTDEEFEKTYTGCLGNYTKNGAVEYKSMDSSLRDSIPESLDWREKKIVTRVKDQKRCGSCYIFSAIGCLESQHAKTHGELIELSEQQSLDCNSNGCNGGLPHQVMFALKKTGVMKESDYPYEGKQLKCRYDASKVVVKVKDVAMVILPGEEDLKEVVFSQGPLSIGMFTNEQLRHLQGGIFKPKKCDGPKHAVLLVGYGSDGGVPYWLIKNSWGQNWNEGGYFKMIRGEKACDIGDYVSVGWVL